jgi:acetyl esterase/lipase
VRGTVLYAPSDEVVTGLPGGYAWSLGGRPVPEEPIAVDRVVGPVLAIAGGADALRRSPEQAKRIMERLDAAEAKVTHRALIYPGAGHGCGRTPMGCRASHRSTR